MKKITSKITPIIALVFLIVLILAPASTTLAQSYLFRLDREVVNVYWNADGTASIDYEWTFTNEPGAHPIDFIDVGMPNSSFEENSIEAWIGDEPITYISRSEFQGIGTGFALGLEENAIQPGETATVRAYVGRVDRVLYPDNENEDYVSAVFAPTFFGREYVTGPTDLTVYFHLPPGVQPEEPRWHSAPSGFPETPETGLDADGNIVYAWSNPSANAYTSYEFGASFPARYVTVEAMVQPTPMEPVVGAVGAFFGALANLAPCAIWIAVISIPLAISAARGRKQRMKYLPPKISIEGHGIKRGLTAIESAILLEEPLDKVFTMILFAVIKKGAATVRTKEPLELDIHPEAPEGLRDYETDFLAAFTRPNGRERQKKLQKVAIDLVKSVQAKMKGFSAKETRAYYQDIISRAWKQVEAAATPEVKSQKFDEVMEWTMLDRDYDDRMRRTFTGPVYVPMWWGRYDPTWRTPSAPGAPASTPVSTSGGSGGGQTSLPHLPGSDFAASMVNSVQNFSGGVLGGVGAFTAGVSSRTNPPPPASSRSGGFRGGGSGGCACACACAGCACACAGGGR